MRTHRFLVAFLLLLMLLAGCAKEDRIDPMTDGGAIRFEIGFPGQTRVATDTEFNTTWEDGDAIGIFAVPSGQSLAVSGNYIHNVKLKYNGGSWSLDSGVELYWPSGGDRLDFYAYYPYSETADPTAIDCTVQRDQNGETEGKSNYNLSDLLTAKAAKTGGYGKGETVPLTFTHALAMIQVSIDNSTGRLDTDNDITVTLRGAIPDGSLNLTAGTATADGTAPAADIAMLRLDTGDPADLVFRALVPPQTLAAGRQMFRTSDGSIILDSAPLAAPLTLVAGRAETFTQDMQIGDYAPLIGDNGFRQYCLQEFDTDGNGKLSHDEVQAVTRIDLSLYGIPITHLQGIEYFSNLTYLDCFRRGLTEIDLSGLDGLTYLDCSDNRLSELDLSGLDGLTELICSDNQLTELDLSGFDDLTSLICSGNQLTELDLSGLGALTDLWCENNQLSELDLSGLGDLTRLYCTGNQLTELNLSELGDLTSLHCYDNQLTELDLSGLDALTELLCYDNQLDELNVSGLNALAHLYCNGNPIAELDVSGNNALFRLRCGMGDGTHSLTVWVDSGRTLGSGFIIEALRMEGTAKYFDRITARNETLNGVTVKDKQ